MVALAALVWLPWRALLVVSVGMIVLHNTLDGIRPEQFGSAHWLWRLLHDRGPLPEWGVRVGYPLIPWIGVMAAGYCFGRVLDLEPDRRRRLLVRLGLGLVTVFVVLRWSNLYGDPFPWTTERSPILTVASFLNCEKYPPSLLYVLMTLGPMLLMLAAFEGVRARPWNPLLVFGRVPLFYYLLHLPLLHGSGARRRTVALRPVRLHAGSAAVAARPASRLSDRLRIRLVGRVSGVGRHRAGALPHVPLVCGPEATEQIANPQLPLRLQFRLQFLNSEF